MVDLIHMSLEIALIIAASSMSLYSFRLFLKFFKGGIFGSAFEIFGFASLLFASVYLLDVVLDFLGEDFEYFYQALSLVFVLVLFYGIHKLYRAWGKLEQSQH